MISEPPTARGRRTWHRIVEAAADLFRRDGVNATSLDDVLRESASGKGQLYHYFPGKSELVVAVLDHQLGKFLNSQRPFLAELDDWPGIRRWLDALPAEFIVGARSIAACPIGALAAELGGTDENVRVALVAAFDRWAAYLADGLTSMRERGELTEEADPVRLAMTTIAALQGGLLLARTYRDATLLSSALDAAYANLRVYRRAEH